MSEQQIDLRRNWKAETFEYDIYIPDESEECQYCLTRKQAEILSAIVTPLAWKTRWWSDVGTDIDQDTIEAFRDDIIRRLMMSCCGGEFETIFRWTEDGTLQSSTDGGTTWQDDPQDDPRNSSPIFPPVPGDVTDDKKCIAATSAMTLIKEQVGDQLTDDMSRYTLGQIISDWVNTVLQTSNVFEAIVTIVTNQILALVIATLRPALTDSVYDKLKCCILSSMADDLSFDDAQWTAVRSCITSDISGIAGVFFEHLIYLIGKVGLTNLVRSQAATSGDCSCGVGCDDLPNWDVVIAGGIVGTITAQSTTELDVNNSMVNTDGRYYIQIQSDDDNNCCTFTSVEWTGDSFDMLCAYNLCGETRATWTHTAVNPGALAGLNINAVMLRTVDPNSMNFHIT